MIQSVKLWFQQSEKNTERVVLICIPIIALIYSWKILFTSSDILPGGLDFPSYISANLVHRRDLLSGIFPLWNNMWSYGVPEYANPLTSLYYPPVLIGFLIFGISTGLKILIYLHLCMSGVFFWIFSQEIVQRSLSRFFGTMLYMLSGLLAGHIFAGHFVNMILTYPWIPLFMFTLHVAIREKDHKHAIFCSGAFAVILILGGYNVFFLSIIVVLFVITSSLIFPESNKGRIKVDWQNIRLFAEILTFTFLFSAIKLIPVVLFSFHIKRPYDPLLGSMNFSEIILSFIDSTSQQSYGHLTKDPFHFYETYAYLGVIPVILVGFSLFNRRTLSVYFFSFLTFIIWIQGFNTIFGFIHYVPIIKSYRVPSRGFFTLSFIIIVLAMSGFDWLYTNFTELTIVQQKKISSFLAIFGFIFILEWGTPRLLGFLTSNSPPRDSDEFYKIAEDLLLPRTRQIAALVVGLLFIFVFFVFILPRTIKLLRRIANPGKALMVAIVLFCSINLILVNRPLYENVRNPYNSELVSRATKAIKQDNTSVMKWTLLSGGLEDRSYYFEYGFISNGIPISNAYYPSSKAYNKQVRPSSFLLNDNSIDLHNYMVTTSESDRPSDILIDSFDVKETYGAETLLDERVYVYRNNDTIPDAFIIQDPQLVQVTIYKYSSNEIVVMVDRGVSGDVLVVKVSYYPGWTVNGQEALNYQGMVAAQIDFPEESTSFKEILLFRFQFKPLDFKLGGFVSLILSPVLVFFLLTKKRPWKNVERFIARLLHERF